jgi:membrane fusion protein (multidrug efflux system)
VQLFSEEQGRVLEIGAEELERVMAGQLLVRMDPLRAEVALDHARAAVARAESESILARANLDRNQGLKRRDVASRKALDEAENAARMAAAAKLDAKASVREAEDRLAKLTISAPFSGILQSFLVEVGELIQPGERIGELLDIDRLRIAIGLTDRQVLAMTPGQRVAVHAEARPDHLFEGEIVHVGLAMDPVTRKFPLRIELDNADRLLLPGMVAKVELTLGEPGEIMPVPLDAVVDEFGLKHAFVVEESESGSRVTKRRIDVRSIAFRPTDLDVVAGLSVGERIAISSVRQLREGMAVRPLPPSNRSTLSRVETAP